MAASTRAIPHVATFEASASASVSRRMTSALSFLALLLGPWLPAGRAGPAWRGPRLGLDCLGDHRVGEPLVDAHPPHPDPRPGWRWHQYWRAGLPSSYGAQLLSRPSR